MFSQHAVPNKVGNPLAKLKIPTRKQLDFEPRDIQFWQNCAFRKYRYWIHSPDCGGARRPNRRKNDRLLTSYIALRKYALRGPLCVPPYQLRPGMGLEAGC